VRDPIFEWSRLDEELLALLGFWSLPVSIYSSHAAQMRVDLGLTGKSTLMLRSMTLSKKGI
jgi:hypothetical protein